MIFCFVILALTSVSAKNFQAHKETYVAANTVYHGEYRGKCGNDGFYYNDESSIVICSNGNAHIQPCAPGSKNSAKEHYEKGTTYVYRDFCDVNLVDDGYTLTHRDATHSKSDYSTKKVAPKVHVAPKVDVKVAEPKVYAGKYEGKCGNDGFYYNDESSIVICSNGNAHIQPCAPGSKNSAKEHYEKGTTYVYRDFCDVNLVDDGYALKHGYAASAKSDDASSKVDTKVHVPPKVEVKVVESKVYVGKYQGKCGNDGFYYNDEFSIVICSNGNAHIQPCAPGSKNSAKEHYEKGTTYVYRDFCDVNLVDDGYALNHGAYSDVPHQKEYGMPDAYAYHGSYDFFGNAHVHQPAPVNYGW
ncbi:hypothetical protein CAPTEDRAFT_224578 [Capitella teleta]|uniref:Chitin-binding type-2 domain-containing protein n=1 Tax=Capitella teleta TaxID=283909 RepID=R7V9B2_CAPTE|nr:hypothetical protein CAPTEDRAFT_224578 [Capitella teleta]|eukprot:ELU15438.1 hypothetical protein CAPTEDRAFT_224578 [Capitella teleta]